MPGLYFEEFDVGQTIEHPIRSKSRADVGIVEFEHVAINQRGEQVAICRRNALMKRRAPAAKEARERT